MSTAVATEKTKEVKNTNKNEMGARRSELESRRTLVPVYETQANDRGFEIQLDLPGVAPENVDIQLENGFLNIVGVGDSMEFEGYQALYSEFRATNYKARFRVPDSIDSGAIEAKVNNGRLNLVLPKAKERLPKKISVNAS